MMLELVRADEGIYIVVLLYQRIHSQLYSGQLPACSVAFSHPSWPRQLWLQAHSPPNRATSQVGRENRTGAGGAQQQTKPEQWQIEAIRAE